MISSKGNKLLPLQSEIILSISQYKLELHYILSWGEKNLCLCHNKLSSNILYPNIMKQMTDHKTPIEQT